MPGDNLPDFRLEIFKLKVQRSALTNNLDRYYLEILESESRKKSACVNIRATQEALDRIDETLNQLIDTHGEVDVSELVLLGN
jgi:hypothetical protein